MTRRETRAFGHGRHKPSDTQNDLALSQAEHLLDARSTNEPAGYGARRLTLSLYSGVPRKTESSGVLSRAGGLPRLATRDGIDNTGHSAPHKLDCPITCPSYVPDEGNCSPTHSSRHSAVLDLAPLSKIDPLNAVLLRTLVETFPCRMQLHN